MILLYAASRDPRRGETPVMCASTVQVAAPPGEVVSNTGKQNRKVLATPVMESFASITGVTTLLRQQHGNCPPPPIFLHSIPFSFVRRSNYRLPLIPSSDGSHACAAEMVRYREERNYEPYSAVNDVCCSELCFAVSRKDTSDGKSERCRLWPTHHRRHFQRRALHQKSAPYGE